MIHAVSSACGFVTVSGQKLSRYALALGNLQKCVGVDFCCINVLEDFLGGSSWRIFLGTFSHKNEEKKSGEEIREKKSGGPKIKIREKSVLPKAGPNKSI